MNKPDKKTMQKNGITLISLVITIILLLILGAVAINLAVDSDGLFRKAGQAANSWNSSVSAEQSAMQNLLNIVEEIGTIVAEGVTLNKTSLSLGIGGTEQLVATIEPEGTTNQNVTWASDNESIATVDEAGIVTGVALGTATITVTTESRGKTATCTVTVSNNPYDTAIVPSIVEETVDGKTRIAPIPAGYTLSGIDAEKTIDNGLVIYKTGDMQVSANFWTDTDDAGNLVCQTDYDQYVWIPVDEITDMVMCQVCGDAGKANLNKTTLECATCTAAGKETKLAGKLYATATGNVFNANLTGQTYTNDDDENFSSATVKLREPDDLTHTTYGDASSTGITAIKGILGDEYKAATTYAQLKDAWNEQLQTDFENMAKSVAKYKGFYISRYEVGVGGSSKKGQDILINTSPTNWYTIYSEIRSNPDIEATTYSQMVWGSQYDQVMKFIAEKTRYDGTGVTTFDIKTKETARHDSTLSRASGSNISDLVCNIYDLEGNYVEWTSEANSDYLRVLRGRWFRQS